ERQVQVHTFAEAGGTDLSELDFRSEVLPGKAQDGEHVDLALFELLPAEFHGVSTARNRVGQGALAFAQIRIAGESIFYIFECAQRGTHIACGSGFLLGGTEILRSLKFTTKENWLSDPTGETTDEGIKSADRVERRGSEPARGAKHKARQARCARLVHPTKGSGEAALARDEVWPAFEDLRRQTGGHAFRLPGKGTSHIKPAGRVAAGHHLHRAGRLRPRGPGGGEGNLAGGG